MSEPILPVEDEPEVEPPVEPDAGGEAGWATAEITGDRVNVFDAPIIAGNPSGARIEIRSTGFHAFNGTGTETAHIDGAEGVFVGGEFRTSDTLPGQVVMSDTALVLDGGTGPGIAVTPINALPYSEMPGIGPAYDGMTVSGGSFITGESSGMRTAPDIVQQWAFTSGGGYSQVYTTGLQTRMERLDDTGDLQSAITADDTQASVLFSTSPDDWKGLYVRGNGVWVHATVGGVTSEYNLEETAQDSGWQPITTTAGYTASPGLAWRNKGGIIWFQGSVTGTFPTPGTWYNVIDSLPEATWPANAIYAIEAGSGLQGVTIRRRTNGQVDIRVSEPVTDPTQMRLSTLIYPIG